MKIIPLRSPTMSPAVAAPALVALALTGLLYGDTLSLPLFSDDLVQIPWLESISWRELWLSPSPYGYYRPLWYTLWRLWGGLVGGLHPVGLHFLNLIAHFVASWLTGLLAAVWAQPLPPGRGSGKSTVPASIASALFAAFPFSRQAVAWPGAVYNPLVSAMAAGALLAYDRGRRGHGTRWFGLALALAAVAPFCYESGLLVAALIPLAEGVGWLSHRWSRRSFSFSRSRSRPCSWRWSLVFVGLLPITLAVWRIMRGAGVTGFGLNPADLQHNASYLIQGLIYPTAPVAQRLIAWQGLDPLLGLWLVALPTLTFLAWGGLRRNRSTFLLGTAWFALFAVPPMVSMEADWFALAPRFLYMTATGSSLIWMAATSCWLAQLHPSWRLLALSGVVATLLAPAVSFVRDGVRLYGMAGESIWDAVEAAAASPSPLLLVNLPMRITPRHRVYPLGFEGVTPLPQRVSAEGLVYVHTGLHDAAQAVAFGVVATDEPPGYTYQLFGREVGWEELITSVRQAGAIYLTRYRPARIHLIEAGGYPAADGEEGEVVGREPVAHFGERVTLLNTDYTCDRAGQVHLTTHWRVEIPVETDVTVFAHLLDPDGVPLTQADGYPLLGMLPFRLWERGEIVRDVRHFEPVPAGEYTLRLGVWDLATGERWSATGYPDGAVLLPVDCP